MAVSDAARRNHDELFPGHVSTLAVTDPELIEVFDNFAFDEVLRHGGLDTRQRLMVQLAALIASQALAEYRVLLGAALTVGVTPVEVKEIVYQAVPYVGMGRVFDFLHISNDILTERGVQLPVEGQATTRPDDRMEKGLAVQKEIVGSDAVDAMYDAAPADALHFQRYLSGNCFGDHVSRAGLDLRTRELLTFAMLVSLGGCDPQVQGHTAANLRVGNDRAVLLSVLTHLLPFIGYPRTLNGLRALDAVAPPAGDSTPKGPGMTAEGPPATSAASTLQVEQA
jgi:4-carboxymuconolactone decarboxylase